MKSTRDRSIRQYPRVHREARRSRARPERPARQPGRRRRRGMVEDVEPPTPALDDVLDTIELSQLAVPVEVLIPGAGEDSGGRSLRALVRRALSRASGSLAWLVRIAGVFEKVAIPWSQLRGHIS